MRVHSWKSVGSMEVESVSLSINSTLFCESLHQDHDDAVERDADIQNQSQTINCSELQLVEMDSDTDFIPVNSFSYLRPRVWALVLQYVYELKLRAFPSRVILKQELRKEPPFQYFRKLLDPKPFVHQDSNRFACRIYLHVNGTMTWWNLWVASIQRKSFRMTLIFATSYFRGAGQAVFCNNPITGLLILAAMAVSDPWILICSMISLLTATTFALSIGVAYDPWLNGLFGYCGLLTGGSVAIFLKGGSWNPLAIPLSVFGGLFCVILTMSLQNSLGQPLDLPPFTLPFVFSNMLLIGCMRSSTYFSTWLQPMPIPMPAVPNLTTAAFFSGVFSGVGQIFFCTSPFSGVIVLIGMLFCSRILALAAVAGSLMGVICAVFLGSGGSDVEAGIWGYNPALVFLSAALFFVPSPMSSVLAILGSIICVFLQELLKASLGLPLGIPHSTLAFCITAFALVTIQFSSRFALRIPTANLTTPEDHLGKVKILRIVCTR